MADKYLGGIKAGSTSVSIDLLVRKKSDSTEVTGLAFGTAGNIASYRRQGAARVAITLVTQTVTGAYSSGGFVEADATNQPGIYRLDIPDAALATGVDYVTLSFVSTNNFTWHERIALSTSTIQSGDSYARLGAPAGASIAADVAANFARVGAPAGASVSADVAAIAAKTTALPTDPADASDIAAAFAAVPAAVLAAATAAPIAADIKKVNAAAVAGVGTALDKWRPL